MTNNVNLKLSTFIIYFNNNIQSGSRSSILDYNHEMPSHVSHADNLSQTGRMLLPSKYISGWLQMMQSLQSTSTQSTRGLSKVSAKKCGTCYRFDPPMWKFPIFLNPSPHNVKARDPVGNCRTTNHNRQQTLVRTNTRFIVVFAHDFLHLMTMITCNITWSTSIWLITITILIK